MNVTSIRFGLHRRALLGVRVVSASNGSSGRTLLASSTRLSRTTERQLGREDDSADPVVPDGRYRIEVTAEAGVEQVTRSVGVVVDRTLGGLSVAPTVVSPNGDGRAEPLAIGYMLTRRPPSGCRSAGGKTVFVTMLNRTQAAGPHTVSWNGRCGTGSACPGRRRHARRLATTSLGTRALARPIRLDTRAPVVRVFSLRTVNGIVRLRFTLDEAATVRILLRSATRGATATTSSGRAARASTSSPAE